MLVNLNIPEVSMNLFFNGEFLTNLITWKLSIVIDWSTQGKNKFEIEASSIFMLNEANMKQKQVILGPYRCGNMITSDPEAWEEICSWLEKKGTKMLKIKMTMYLGEKEMIVDLDKAKIFMRPYIFMLLSHFFVEGLPKYKLTDKDLPNAIQTNPEEAPKMSVELNMWKSMICLDDERRAIACLSTITFVFDRLCISKIKNQLASKSFSAG